MLSSKKFLIFCALVCVSAFLCLGLQYNPFSHLFAEDAAKSGKVYFPKSEKKSRHEIPKACHHQLVYIVEGKNNEVIPVNLATGVRYTPLNFDFSPKVKAVSVDSEKLYVTDDEGYNLYEYDLYFKKIEQIASFKLPLNHMVLSKKGEIAYLAFENERGISLFDIKERTEKDFIELEDVPTQLTLQPHNDTLFVTYENRGEVSSLKVNDKKVETFLKFKTSPDQMDLSYDGLKLYFNFSDTTSLYQYQLESGDLKEIEFKSDRESFLKYKCLALLINKYESKAYIVKEDNSEIYVADFKSGEITAAYETKEVISSVQFGSILEIEASFKVETAPAGKHSHFDASSTVPISAHITYGKVSYHWDFGDGLLAVAEDPEIEHIYEKSGDFNVKLTASQNIESPYTLLLNDIPAVEKISLVSDSEQAITVSKLLEEDANLALDDIQPLALGVNTSLTQATPSQANIIFGQSVYDMAVVSGVQVGDPTPTGTVTFFVDSTQLDNPVVLTAALNDTATANSINYTPPTVGTYQFTAQYDGDDYYAGSIDSSITNTFTVSKVSSTVNLASTPNPSVFGQNVLMTATVTLDSVSNSIATGNVEFQDGGVTLATVALTAGQATYNTTLLSVGSHTLTAVYLGDTNFEGNTSNSLTQTVQKGATTTSLTSSVNPLYFGNTTLLTATVAPTGGAAGTLTNNVNFKDGTTVIGSVPVVGGVATLNVSNFSVATHNLTAEYLGNTNFLGSTSTPVLPQVVVQATTSSAVTSNPLNTAYGHSDGSRLKISSCKHSSIS